MHPQLQTKTINFGLSKRYLRIPQKYHKCLQLASNTDKHVINEEQSRTKRS